MNHKLIILISILYIMVGHSNAQTMMFVKEASNHQSSFLLSDIEKVTFSNGNMAVSTSGGSNHVFDVSEMRYVSFSDFYTSIHNLENIEIENGIIFPNPVVDRLYLGNITTNSMADILLVEIIDVHGRRLISQNISHDGLSSASIDASSLPAGIYICRIQSGKMLQTIKFIKK